MVSSKRILSYEKIQGIEYQMVFLILVSPLRPISRVYLSINFLNEFRGFLE